MIPITVERPLACGAVGPGAGGVGEIPFPSVAVGAGAGVVAVAVAVGAFGCGRSAVSGASSVAVEAAKRGLDPVGELVEGQVPGADVVSEAVDDDLPLAVADAHLVERRG